MRKEIVFAIIIGLALGLLITFGIYIANRALKKKSQPETITTTPTPSPTVLAPEISLEISEPDDDRLFSKADITVSGKTNKEAVVTILTEDDEYFTQADEDGLFSTKISLIKGANSLKVVATDLLGNQDEKELTVVYTTKLKEEEDEDE